MIKPHGPLDACSPQITGKEFLLGGPHDALPLRRPGPLDQLSGALGLAVRTRPVTFRHPPKRRSHATEVESAEARVALHHNPATGAEAYAALLHLRVLPVRLRRLPPLHVHVITDLELSAVVHHLPVVCPLSRVSLLPLGLALSRGFR